MPFVGTTGIVVLTVVIGALMTLFGAGQLSTYRRLRRSDPVDVRSLAGPSGSVEFAGTARVHEATDRSPLTDTESILCEWTVERYSGGKGSNWTRLASGETTHPFLLEADTGTVLVDPAGASLRLPESTTIEVEEDESPPATVAAYLRESDEVDREQRRDRRYQESRLDPGDDVHVLGPVQRTGLSVDMPGGVDAVVGVENPEERAFTFGEDDLSKLLEQVRGHSEPFVVSRGGEAAAERRMLKLGLIFLAMGLLFLGVPLLALL